MPFSISSVPKDVMASARKCVEQGKPVTQAVGWHKQWNEDIVRRYIKREIKNEKEAQLKKQKKYADTFLKY